MGKIKYGVLVPRSIKQALQFDKDNKDTYWRDPIIKEIEALMGHKTFDYLEANAR